MKKTYVLYSIITIFILSACSSVTTCTDNISTNGYFCYQEYNFGKDKSSIYKHGVRDGCRTANGYYKKDYSLSSNSAQYSSGWDAGRATCKLIVPESATPGMRTEYQQSLDEKSRSR